MTRYLIAYGITAVVFFVIDFFWITRFARQFYADQMGDLLAAKPNIGAAAAFYLVYLVGVVVFAVAPALKAGSITTALIYGGLFGFIAYATYDMTNYATLKNWPLPVTIVDLVWGTCLTAVCAAAGYWGTQMLVRG